MISSLSAAIPQSGGSSFPKDIFLFEEIKSLVEAQIRKTGIPKRFKPRLYTYTDYILPILYALTTSLSIHQACEELNTLFISHMEQSHGIKMKSYADGIRKRRLIPHQTKIDEFLRRFTEEETQQFFGNLLSSLNLIIKKQEVKGTKLKFMADNTKYPYYGEMRTDTEIGSPKLPGTKLCRMFQGHSIFGAKMHLFTYFSIIKKGVYRCKDIFSEIQWLRWCGFKLSYGVVDREFYRATLIRDFKKLKLGMIIPSKKFQAVKNEMMEFLRKHRKVVDNYLFSQSNKQYPHQSSANVFLAFVGHKDKSAHDVRDEYYHSKKNIHDMVKELAGFFTTIVPWKNIKSFCKFLSRTYKTRWNIETGFRCLNSTHRSFRNRDPVKQLCQMYLKAIIYNNWQFWRKRKLKECTTSSDAAQVLYLRKYSQAVVSILSDIVSDRVNYALKNKMEVYFQ